MLLIFKEKEIREIDNEVIEFVIDESEKELLGDVSSIPNGWFEFPLHVDRHGVEDKNRVRIYGDQNIMKI